jgi:tetratricopeptide (TPR) repeat protein
MLKLTPLLAALLGAGMLQGCATAPAQQQQQQTAARPAAQARGADTYYRLGKHLQERGELELAQAAFAMSIERDKGQLEARNAAAALHARQGRLDQAAALLRQLVADFPAQAHPYNNLGYVYYMQGNYADAAATLRLALRLDQQNALARSNLNLAETALAEAPRTPAAPLAAAAAMPAVTEMPTVVVMPAPPAAALAAPAPAAPVAPGRVELVQLEANVYQLKFNNVSVPPPAVLPIPALPAADRLAKAPAPQPARLEIANGNGVTGMAKRLRQVLARLGIPVRRLSNERPYTQRNTTIQYRPGYEREAADLQRALKGEVSLLASKGLSGDADLRLVLGKDGAEQLARFEAAAGFPLLASNDIAL